MVQIKFSKDTSKKKKKKKDESSLWSLLKWILLGITWRDGMLFISSPEVKRQTSFFSGVEVGEAGRWNEVLMELDSPSELFACPLLSFRAMQEMASRIRKPCSLPCKYEQAWSFLS